VGSSTSAASGGCWNQVAEFNELREDNYSVPTSGRPCSKEMGRNDAALIRLLGETARGHVHGAGSKFVFLCGTTHHFIPVLTGEEPLCTPIVASYETMSREKNWYSRLLLTWTPATKVRVAPKRRFLHISTLKM
jgi:hypothetical protein